MNLVGCNCGAPAGQHSSVKGKLGRLECMTMSLWRFGCLDGEAVAAVTPYLVRPSIVTISCRVKGLLFSPTLLAALLKEGTGLLGLMFSYERIFSSSSSEEVLSLVGLNHICPRHPKYLFSRVTSAPFDPEGSWRSSWGLVGGRPVIAGFHSSLLSFSSSPGATSKLTQ